MTAPPLSGLAALNPGYGARCASVGGARPLAYGSPAAFLASPVSSRMCSPVLARSTT
jgi:hypothetical protein